MVFNVPWEREKVKKDTICYIARSLSLLFKWSCDHCVAARQTFLLAIVFDDKSNGNDDFPLTETIFEFDFILGVCLCVSNA